MKMRFLFLISMAFSISALAGALRIPDGRGETIDYSITAASLKNGAVTLEARKYRRSSNENLEETERKYFTLSSDILKSNGIESGSLILLVLDKNMFGDVFCDIHNFASKKSAAELECSSIVVSARQK